ncbi:MAG TPA: heme NO-binding domain-containing protein [Ktedonobacterales bacterium]|nr:heme NO-binding domain-containing protein [Ktedonobacterales bacterium]
MHGLVFVTWEKYLGDRFGDDLLYRYRTNMSKLPYDVPLANRVYDDSLLLAGITEASRLTNMASGVLLYEYGAYFISNGLTRRQCAYLLSQARNGRDLLLAMRDAHRQISETSSAVMPPLFEYSSVSGSPDGLMVHYGSPRKLCQLLHGAFEGAAQLFGERAQVQEVQCMHRGAPECIFFVRFVPAPNSMVQGQKTGPLSDSQRERWQTRRALADLVYSVLPDSDGVTLPEIQNRLRQQGAEGNQLRPFLILEAINLLHHAGWATSTAVVNDPSDDLGHRRYWRLARATP